MNIPETMIADAMERSAQFAAQAAEEHLHAFTAQMRELFGIEKITLNEPYLPFLLVRAELRYLRRLAKLEARLQATKSYTAYEWNGLEYKAEDISTSDANVASAIDAETNRAAIEAKQDLDAARQQAFGITQYQWHGGSCSICAPYDGQLCTWGEGMQPGGVHPNCQCSGAPVVDGAGAANPPEISGSNITDAALLLASLIPIVRAGRIGVAAVRGLGAVGRRILGQVRGSRQGHDPSKRPEGVPKDWKASSTKNGEGKIYQHPTEKGTYVKVQKGNPNASQPGQRYDNVRVQKNGNSYDKNGNIVPRRSQESHIPLEDFNPENFNL